MLALVQQQINVMLLIANVILITFIPAGRGGASIYGKQFEDEFHPELKFTGKYYYRSY